MSLIPIGDNVCGYLWWYGRKARPAKLTCRASAPARGHHEAGDHQTETDAQVPVADVGDRVVCRRDVEGHDPEQTQEHQTEHHRGEPRGVGHGRLGIALDW